MEKLLPDINVVLSEQLWEDGFDSKIDLLTLKSSLLKLVTQLFFLWKAPDHFVNLEHLLTQIHCLVTK